MAAEDGTQSEMVVGGRYADQFERRKGEWRIARRLFIHAWNQNGAATVQWDSGLYAQINVRGRPDRDDPSRSEEHTSELQSLVRTSYAVLCLKKKNHNTQERQS